jgi:hypothetical protein
MRLVSEYRHIHTYSEGRPRSSPMASAGRLACMAAERELQLRVELVEVQPSVWRRLLVPASYTLRQLHFAIQQAMPWSDRHLYESEITRNRYGAPDPFDDDEGLLDDSDVPLESGASVGARFRYTYDFGDDWRHDILIEKALPAGSGTRCPSCVDGNGAAPPDDVGGPHGYAML